VIGEDAADAEGGESSELLGDVGPVKLIWFWPTFRDATVPGSVTASVIIAGM